MKLRLRIAAVRALAGIFAATLLLGGLAQGKLPGQEKIPANALLAVGIADTGQFWTKTGALPLTQAVTQYLESQGQQSAADSPFQQFQLERQKLEATLGFPATPAEFMQNVFSSLLLTVEPAAPAGGKPAVKLTLGVKDKAKAAKLIEALNKKHQEEADATPAAAGAKNSFEQLTINGVKVSHHHTVLPGGQAVDGFCALAGDKLIFCGDRGTMEAALAGKAQAGDELGKNPQFAKLSAALPWEKAEAEGWIDSSAILAFMKNPQFSMLSQLKPGENEKLAFTLEMGADGIVGQVASSTNPVKEGGPKPRTLASLSYLPQAPLVALVYGLFDPAQTYQFFTSLANTFSMASALQGSGNTPPNPLAEVEKTLGISIQNELVPALGGEVMASFNNLRIDLLGGSPPAVDVVLGVEVRDAAKMKAVMDKFEKFLEKQIGGMGGGQGDSAKFATIPGPTPIRTLNTGQPMLSPSYALTKNYLLFSINTDAVTAALGRGAGQQQSAASSPIFGELKAIAGTDQIYSYSVIDVRQATQTVLMPAMSMVILAAPGKLTLTQQQVITAILTQILPKVGTAASMETIKDGLAMGYFKIKM